jgi:LuxR family maltose regulon positive regulatory protein
MSRALALVDPSDEERPAEKSNGPTPLLETKLYVPRPRSELVARPRLADAMHAGADSRLTLVIAPAGFGKTTLVASCLAEEKSVGWVSLDASENEPAVFWAYVIRALQRVNTRLGAHALGQLRSPRPPAIESVVKALINEIDKSDGDFILVLDDYHVIEAASVHRDVAFLLDHLPRRMRVVIASRAEPPLPLPRLRARGELTELRATDLRFTQDEATAFLNEVMSLALSADDAARLERSTEGWIAALKLAALSMKGRRNVSEFVAGFSGDNRFIADYLVDEVLRSEPEQVRHFLLATSILGRMNADLCDAVTDADGSRAILEDLERRSLFVVALDDRREWYRYHHLFADVLQKLGADSASMRVFHGRASAWYEQRGESADAVSHALAAQDFELAARILERDWPEKNRSYEAGRWLARVKTLPEAAVRTRPVLGMGYAWALLNAGELEAAEHWLGNVEESLKGTGPKVVGDDERFRSLDSELTAARVYLSQSRGDVPGTVEHAERALASVPPGDVDGRITPLALLALARWSRGELDVAYRTFSSALDAMHAAGREMDVIRGTFVLGDLRVAQGRLREAVSHYQHGLQLGAESPNAAIAEIDELHLGMSEVHCEWNDLATAGRHLDALVQPEGMAYRIKKHRWGTAMARLCEARGDLEGALEWLEDAERHERRDPMPRVRPIPALKARIHLAQGRREDALDWATKARLSADDDLSFAREFEHVTLARILIARGDRHVADAALLLERLRAEAELGGRAGSVIEILVLEALAQQALAKQRAALDALSQALGIAEPERFLRVFLDEGTRMRDLLKTATARGLAGSYTRRVLAAFDAPPPVVQSNVESAGSADPVQPLTTRELEILRLIAAGLRNQEIANELSISAATVKRHIANAYGKLGVAHRTEAVARANELHLL